MGTGVAGISLKNLDPGIRDVVAALWDRGLATTDSGDGVSKPKPGIVLPFEHVAVVPGKDVDATMQVAVEVLADVRPGESWQIEYARSRTVTDATLRETMLIYRIPSEAHRTD